MLPYQVDHMLQRFQVVCRQIIAQLRKLVNRLVQPPLFVRTLGKELKILLDYLDDLGVAVHQLQHVVEVLRHGPDVGGAAAVGGCLVDVVFELGVFVVDEGDLVVPDSPYAA